MANGFDGGRLEEGGGARVRSKILRNFATFEIFAVIKKMKIELSKYESAY